MLQLFLFVFQEVGEITFTLGNVMQIVHNHVNKLTELSSQVFKTILKNIVDCSAVKFEEIVEEVSLYVFFSFYEIC